MKTKLITLLFALFFAFSYAQERIYFDQEWKVITDASKAKFYRETTKENGLYHIKDYYISGKIQMDAHAKNNDPNNEIFVGEVKWYFENGKLSQLATYKNGEQEGKYEDYDAYGRPTLIVNYKSGDIDYGKAFSYKQKSIEDTLGYGNWSSVTTYEKGSPKSLRYFDDQPEGIGYEVFYGGGSQSNDLTLYYDKNGKKIGELIAGREYPKGKEVEYYENPISVKKISTYNGKGYYPVSFVSYYKNGMKQTENKTSITDSKKQVTEIYYDKAGNKIGEYNGLDAEDHVSKEKGSFCTFDGDGNLSTKRTFANDAIQSEETFFPSGKIKDKTLYKEGERTETVAFDESGHQLAKLIYHDGEPFDGKLIEENSESVYQSGKLVSEDYYRTSTDENGKVKRAKLSEKRTASGIMTTKIFNFKGEKLYEILDTTKPDDDYSDYYNAKITTFENGKPKYTAIVERSELKSGIFQLNYGNTKEIRKVEGDWYVVEFYNGDKLIRIMKQLLSEDDDNSYYSTYTTENYVSEELFLRGIDEDIVDEAADAVVDAARDPGN